MGLLQCPVWGQGLDSMILVRSFQLWIFHDSMSSWKEKCWEQQKVEGWVLWEGFRAVECLFLGWHHSAHGCPVPPLQSWDRLGKLAYADRPCGPWQCGGPRVIFWVMLCVSLCSVRRQWVTGSERAGGPKGGCKHPRCAIVTHAGAGGGEARSSGSLWEVTQFPHRDVGREAGGSGGSGGPGGRWAGSGRLQRLPVSAGSGWHCAAQRGGQSLFLHLPRASAREKISMATLPVPPSLFHRGQGALPLPAPTQLGCPQGGDRPLVPWVMGSGTAWLCCSVAPCHGSLLVPPCGPQASG